MDRATPPFPARQRMLAALLRAVARGVGALPPRAASNLGGWIARTIGPHLPPCRVAEANLRRALPALDAPARARIIRATWDNLGRTLGELPHLPALRRTGSGPGWDMVGEEQVDALRGRQVLFFSGHLDNWEMILPVASQSGLALSGIYRAASNQAVDGVIQAMRQAALGPGVRMFAKGAKGAREALRHMEAGGSLGLLVDQKMNDGIAVPFFGRPAMTAPALALFALRYDCPIVPARIQRLGPARLRMVVEPPLDVPRTGDRATDVLAIMTAVNATLERWVRAEPGSWLWLHRRWPKDQPNDASSIVKFE